MYENSNYLGAIKNTLSAFKLHPEQINNGDRYNLACSYSLAENKESAFAQLRILAEANYDDYDWMLEDKDLESLHSDKRWIEILDIFKKHKD